VPYFRIENRVSSILGVPARVVTTLAQRPPERTALTTFFDESDHLLGVENLLVRFAADIPDLLSEQERSTAPRLRMVCKSGKSIRASDSRTTVASQLRIPINHATLPRGDFAIEEDSCASAAQAALATGTHMPGDIGNEYFD
jgi:hypothetical protein